MKLFRSISALLLTALVLVASSSFYVGVHSCGGTVKAVAFLNEADGCGHQELPPCHRKVMEGCCNDEQVVHESQDLKVQSPSVSLSDLASVEVIHHTVVLSEIIPAIQITSSYPDDHPPALTGHDIIISIQSFLI
jgi:hypothetical protein